MLFDYNKLHLFVQIVKKGSLTAAAKSLFRTQPAISQSLQSLENALGYKLLSFSKRQMVLTPKGRALFESIQERFSGMDHDLSLLFESDKSTQGSFSIGWMQNHSTRLGEFLPRILSSFKAKSPQSTFHLRFGTEKSLESQLLSGELHMAFLINFEHRQRFRRTEITTEHHYVVTAPSYLREIGELSGIDHLFRCQILDLDSSLTCMTPWVQRHFPQFSARFKEKKASLTAPDFKVLKDLVLLGQGISVLPYYLIHQELKSGELVRVCPSHAPLTVKLDHAMLRDQEWRPCDRLFLEHLMEALPLPELFSS